MSDILHEEGKCTEDKKTCIGQIQETRWPEALPQSKRNCLILLYSTILYYCTLFYYSLLYHTPNSTLRPYFQEIKKLFGRLTELVKTWKSSL